MAQALYNDHPVEEYLRDEAGESDALERYLPGIHPRYDHTLYPLPPMDLRFLAPVFCLVSLTVREERRQRKAAEEFAEQFKYRLVSSALLSSSVGRATSPKPSPVNGGSSGAISTGTFSSFFHRDDQTTTQGTTAVPGKWNAVSLPLVSVHEEEDVTLDNEVSLEPFVATLTDMNYKQWSKTLPPFPLVCVVVLVVLRVPFILAPFSLLALPFVSVPSLEAPPSGPQEAAYAETLASLDTLIEASQIWEQVSSEALALLQSETSSPLPSLPSPLAHSLSTTLLQTTGRFTSIRSLLSALAKSPKELQMLERMYGPQTPSPFRQSFGEGSREKELRGEGLPSREVGVGRARRPNSIIGIPSQQIPHGNDQWNTDSSPQSSRRYSSVSRPSSTPYVSPALSPVSPSLPPRFHSSSSASSNAPSTSTLFPTPSRRQSQSHTHATPASQLTRPSPLLSRRRTISKPSPLTNLRTVNDRDPLSLSTLIALRDQTKTNIRHTAGCLLSLRFLSPEEPSFPSFRSSFPSFGFLSPPKSHKLDRKVSEDSFMSSDIEGDNSDFLDAIDATQSDPAYWEDVRSVLGLFKSALEEASDRLAEAITDRQRGATSLPSPPPTSPFIHHALPVDPNVSEERDTEMMDILKFLRGRTSVGFGGMASGFAPVPSNLSRFVRHIEAMEEALNEAKLSLKETVASLAADSSPSDRSSSLNPEEAMLAFDRLRSALGVALRECERGRGPLVDHLYPPALSQPITKEGHDHALGSDTPQLIHDDERSLADSCYSPDVISHSSLHPLGALDSSAMIIEGHVDRSLTDPEGPSLHTLLSEALLGMPEGKEQIFEDDAAAPSFKRERSNLSREERIKLAKARREDGPVQDNASRRSSGMGPGMEVVQELKDAIWQVGERRRRIGISNDESARDRSSSAADDMAENSDASTIAPLPKSLTRRL